MDIKAILLLLITYKYNLYYLVLCQTKLIRKQLENKVLSGLLTTVKMMCETSSLFGDSSLSRCDSPGKQKFVL